MLDYQPFGSIRLDEKAGNFNERKKFTGHEYDAETGLNYMQARYQSGNVGRFISVDPASRDNPVKFLIDPQQLNTYSYAKNNPLNFIDPLGLETKTYVEKGNGKDGWKSMAGHTFIEINRDGKSTVYTWNSNDGKKYNGGDFGEDLGITTIDNYLGQEGKNADSYAVYTFNTNKEQESDINNFYMNLAEENSRIEGDERLIFDPLTYNCTNASVDAMKAGGILDKDFSSNLFVSTPNGLMNKLDDRYKWQNTNKYFRWMRYSADNEKIMNIKEREILKTSNR